MNINNDNYEEYFLLFADNELSARDRNMVEVFVKQHPGLEEEFLNITQSVLAPENDVTLDDKNSLFRHSEKIIDQSNYEEVLIQYIDNELSLSERNQTEAFLAANPSLKSDLALWQKTKLQPDKAIVFPDKKLLLKKAEGGRVVPFRWWKAMAAAILLGMGTWMGVKLVIKKPEVPVTVKINTPLNPANIRPLPADTANSKPANVVEEFIAKNTQTKPSLKQKTVAQKSPVKLPEKAREVDNYQVLKNQKPTNNLPDAGNRYDKIKNVAPDIIAKGDLKNNIDKLNKDINDNEGRKALQQDEITVSAKNTVPDVVVASYTNDDNDNNDNYAFYNISQEKFNKSKVGGFLRKVKRIIERKISPLNGPKSQSEIAVN